MPIYTISEAVVWLARRRMRRTDKALRKAIERGDLPSIRIGTVYVVSEHDLRRFLRNPPRLGRKKKG